MYHTSGVWKRAKEQADRDFAPVRRILDRAYQKASSAHNVVTLKSVLQAYRDVARTNPLPDIDDGRCYRILLRLDTVLLSDELSSMTALLIQPSWYRRLDHLSTHTTLDYAAQLYNRQRLKRRSLAALRCTLRKHREDDSLLRLNRLRALDTGARKGSTDFGNYSQSPSSEPDVPPRDHGSLQCDIGANILETEETMHFDLKRLMQVAREKVANGYSSNIIHQDDDIVSDIIATLKSASDNTGSVVSSIYQPGPPVYQPPSEAEHLQEAALAALEAVAMLDIDGTSKQDDADDAESARMRDLWGRAAYLRVRSLLRSKREGFDALLQRYRDCLEATSALKALRNYNLLSRVINTLVLQKRHIVHTKAIAIGLHLRLNKRRLVLAFEMWKGELHGIRSVPLLKLLYATPFGLRAFYFLKAVTAFADLMPSTKAFSAGLYSPGHKGYLERCNTYASRAAEKYPESPRCIVSASASNKFLKVLLDPQMNQNAIHDAHAILPPTLSSLRRNLDYFHAFSVGNSVQRFVTSVFLNKLQYIARRNKSVRRLMLKKIVWNAFRENIAVETLALGNVRKADGHYSLALLRVALRSLQSSYTLFIKVKAIRRRQNHVTCRMVLQHWRAHCHKMHMHNVAEITIEKKGKSMLLTKTFAALTSKYSNVFVHKLVEARDAYNGGILRRAFAGCRTVAQNALMCQKREAVRSATLLEAAFNALRARKARIEQMNTQCAELLHQKQRTLGHKVLEAFAEHSQRLHKNELVASAFLCSYVEPCDVRRSFNTWRTRYLRLHEAARRIDELASQALMRNAFNALQRSISMIRAADKFSAHKELVYGASMQRNIFYNMKSLVHTKTVKKQQAEEVITNTRNMKMLREAYATYRSAYCYHHINGAVTSRLLQNAFTSFLASYREACEDRRITKKVDDTLATISYDKLTRIKQFLRGCVWCFADAGNPTYSPFFGCFCTDKDLWMLRYWLHLWKANASKKKTLTTAYTAASRANACVVLGTCMNELRTTLKHSLLEKNIRARLTFFTLSGVFHEWLNQTRYYTALYENIHGRISRIVVSAIIAEFLYVGTMAYVVDRMQRDSLRMLMRQALHALFMQRRNLRRLNKAISTADLRNTLRISFARWKDSHRIAGAVLKMIRRRDRNLMTFALADLRSVAARTVVLRRNIESCCNKELMQRTLAALNKRKTTIHASHALNRELQTNLLKLAFAELREISRNRRLARKADTFSSRRLQSGVMAHLLRLQTQRTAIQVAASNYVAARDTDCVMKLFLLWRGLAVRIQDIKGRYRALAEDIAARLRYIGFHTLLAAFYYSSRSSVAERTIQNAREQKMLSTAFKHFCVRVAFLHGCERTIKAGRQVGILAYVFSIMRDQSAENKTRNARIFDIIARQDTQRVKAALFGQMLLRARRNLDNEGKAVIIQKDIVLAGYYKRALGALLSKYKGLKRAENLIRQTNETALLRDAATSLLLIYRLRVLGRRMELRDAIVVWMRHVKEQARLKTKRLGQAALKRRIAAFSDLHQRRFVHNTYALIRDTYVTRRAMQRTADLHYNKGLLALCLRALSEAMNTK